MTLSVAAALHAQQEIPPKPQPKPKPASEALLAAACGSKGGLLLRAPEGEDAKDQPESLFGPPEAETADAPSDAGAVGGEKAPKKPKVLQIKARGKDPKAAKKACREDFRKYYAAHGDLKVAVAPGVEGEMNQADRERMFAVLTRSAPLLPLKSMSAKSIADQQTLSRRLFDGNASISADELSGALTKAERTLDRRAADAAKQATMIGSIHLRDQERMRQQLAGQPLSPDLRQDPEFRSAARAYTPPPSLGPRRGVKEEPVMTGPEPSALHNLSLVDVPPPTAVPTSGSSRGSIIADVKAALSGLGIKVLGRDSWNARFGSDAPEHTPMKITVHHSAGAPSHNDANLRSQMKGWEGDHMKRGFGRMGYHYAIDDAGDVVEGTGTELVGSHTLNNNAGNVGICLAGNFDKQEPTDKMLASLVGLMSYIGARYDMDTTSPDFVRGHEHYVRKACPGSHVMNKLRHIREKAVELVLAQRAGSKGTGAITVAAVVN